jgi:hypothetical protein
VQFQPVELVHDAMTRPGQKARAHAIGFFAQAQIEARGLYLITVERNRGGQRTGLEQGRDLVIGQNASLVQGRRLPGQSTVMFRARRALAEQIVDARPAGVYWTLIPW